MSEANIRTQIYTILSSVTNIGKVYDYERWANDWATFINFFKTTIGGIDQIRGWEISRRSAPEKQVGISSGTGKYERAHSFVIRGYLGVKDADATEKTFNALIEAIATAFRGNRKLNGTAERHDLIQTDIIEPRMFGSVLCHYAELSLTATERI
jgi:hypothetical protein